jgi:hypothetical protein
MRDSQTGNRRFPGDSFVRSCCSVKHADLARQCTALQLEGRANDRSRTAWRGCVPPAAKSYFCSGVAFSFWYAAARVFLLWAMGSRVG